MAYRTLKIVTLFSAVMLAASVLLFLASAFVNPWESHFSLSEEFHVSLWARGFDSRLVLFNNADY